MRDNDFKFTEFETRHTNKKHINKSENNTDNNIDENDTVDKFEERKKRILARRKKMKRRRILFFILVGLIILAIIKIVFAIFNRPDKNLLKPNLGAFYLGEVIRIKSGVYTRPKLVIKEPQDQFLEVYSKAYTIPKKLMPNSNHILSADEYAYNTAEIRSYIRGEKEYTGGDNLVFLTFDDGPNTTITPQILNILKKNDAHGTFFVPGRNVTESNYGMLKKIIMSGNSIGLHSFSHDYDVLYPERIANTEKIVEEARLTQGRLEKVFGKKFKVTPWRYPGGHMSWQKIHPADQALADIGVEWIDWNCLSGDAERKTLRPDTVQGQIDYVITTLNENLHSNVAVVLMHDSTNKQLTADSLQGIIDYFKNNGYKFCILK